MKSFEDVAMDMNQCFDTRAMYMKQEPSNQGIGAGEKPHEPCLQS